MHDVWIYKNASLCADKQIHLYKMNGNNEVVKNTEQKALNSL